MISKAVEALKNKQLICFPTETVYALAGDAYSIEVIHKIYKIKNRPYNKPVSLLLSNIDQIKQFSNLTEHTTYIIQQLSPGPITFILPIHNYGKLPQQFFYNKIGIRIPNHPIALAILNNFDHPITATSVNISGQQDATSVDQISDNIKKNISFIIDNNRLVHGTASTVIDLTSYQILRKGAVTKQTIQEILKKINIILP
ncbi:Sua5/YciO/YrdC/YwlC family protein [Ehrlichia ruminantium]|uniref:L-threonylcarbamoyladenylate synthase n=1 Tax=Ehrlichia ruminantium TaxID=779 RepID=A0A170RSB8_EHRRU|nr:L-threonylcarbamoyladenylate synthase [Ehrlichia ruminantium]GAT75138.1 Sua5/YciO/YrdC/YwlC family protein [Ehrlichia ruminantium]GAT77132.1 Sua5/YciO/YrdC/YwlC family protein [Ehrlichia ruminantium]